MKLGFFDGITLPLVLGATLAISGCANNASKKEMVLVPTGERVEVEGCNQLKRDIDAYNLAHPEDRKEYPC